MLLLLGLALQERRENLFIVLGCALVGATLIYWYLWSRDFAGWRTVAETRYRVFPAPPLTAADLLPEDAAGVMGMAPPGGRVAVVYPPADPTAFLAHVPALPGALVHPSYPERFQYRGYWFHLVAAEVDEVGLVVEGTDCPEDIVLEVANHFNQLVRLRESYRCPSPLHPLWCMLTVVLLLAVLAMVNYLLGGG